MEKTEINTRFTYHQPKPDQIPRYNAIRDAARDFALMLRDLTPESREQSLAMTSLEEVVFWANAAIARRSGPTLDEIVDSQALTAALE